MNIQLKRVFSTFLILMIFMFTLGQSIVPLIVNAEELNTTGFVDSFKIDKTTLNYGEQTTITVKFSDKSGNQMKAGDTLTLTLPQELQGFTGSIPLKNEEGTDFGTCEVTTSDVVCTFSDTVEKLDNIRGHFYFKVMASYVAANETKTIETDLGTSLAKQLVTIIGPTGGGTSSRFFGKVGDILPNNTNEVRWALYINSAQKYLDKDIVILDNLQSGQTLKENSFSIAINDDYISMDQIQKYGIHINITSGTSFEVVIDKDQANGNKFLINYKTDITADGKKQDAFYNNYEVDYQIRHEDRVTDKGDTKVKNIDMGGEADGDLPPKGTLRIVKHIAGNEEKGIPNVLFKLYTESGQQIGDTYTTDAEGKVEVPDLKVGNYYVQEFEAPDYLDFDPQVQVKFTIDANAEKGVELKIPNKVKTMSVSGTKTWNDNNAPDRPSIINVDLLQNATVVQTQEVTAANGWSYSFEDVPTYDTEGNAYTYTVQEQPVAGYTSEVHGYNITNTKVVQTTTVEGTKTWKDGDAADRPSSIKVDLLQNGKVIDTKVVTTENNWKYEFTDLAAYDADGKAYTYSVKEQSVAGYKSEVHGYDITNTKVAQTSVEGTKTWKDDNAADRPSTIKVDLLQNGQVMKTQEVTAENDWKYAFANLAAYDADGKAYTYTVQEQSVAGYKSEVNGYNIINTRVGQTTVEGTKTWKDDNATDRPIIKVDLLQNGQVIQTQEVTAANGWKYAFVDLATYDADGKAYTYSVKEQPVAGYKSEVHGYDIKNTKVAQTTVEGTKTWKDDNVSDRPSTIKVDLLQNGQVIQTQEVTAANGWKYVFADLVAYDADGKAYTYTVKEHPVAGYKSEVHGYDITNTKLKNSGGTPTDPGEKPKDPSVPPTDPGKKPTDTGKPPTGKPPTGSEVIPTNPVDPLPPTPVRPTTVEGTKTWKGDYAADRPSMILVDLLQNGKVIGTQKVTAESGWKYTFADLTTYDADGNAYTYSVQEHPVAGYKSEVHGYDITNIKVKDSKPTDKKPTGTKTNDSTPNKGNDKTVSLLPKTGESSAGTIFKVVGMLLLIFGVILFFRPRTQ